MADEVEEEILQKSDKLKLEIAEMMDQLESLESQRLKITDSLTSLNQLGKGLLILEISCPSCKKQFYPVKECTCEVFDKYEDYIMIPLRKRKESEKS